MKKAITLLCGSLAILIALSACSRKAGQENGAAVGGNESSVAAESSEVTATPTPEPTPTATPAPTEVPDRKGDFRSGFWGDDADTIKQYEKADFVGDDAGTIIYNVEVAGIDGVALYYLDNNGLLYQGNYSFWPEHTEGTYYIGDYEKLRDALTEVYGEPTSDEKKTINSAAQFCANDGEALKLGYIGYITIWYSGNTKIRLGMTTDNYKTFIGITYYDTTHEEVTDTSGL